MPARVDRATGPRWCFNQAAHGPIFDFLQTNAGVEAVLLSDWPESERAKYAACLTGFGQKLEIVPVILADPTDYGAVYRHADAILSSVANRFHLDEIAIHTSPGTSTMAAVWVLLAKTKYEGVRLFKSWIDKKSGRPKVAEVKIPFSLTLEVIPELAARRATLLSESAEVAEMTVGTFGSLVFRSTKMAQVVRDARKVALFPESCSDSRGVGPRVERNFWRAQFTPRAPEVASSGA